jgi:hypothetical protein
MGKKLLTLFIGQAGNAFEIGVIVRLIIGGVIRDGLRHKFPSSLARQLDRSGVSVPSIGGECP